MEYPRGLLIILALLALGGCWDVSAIVQWGPGAVIAIFLLLGRIAAIAGICMRNNTGWWLAISFFVVIIGLSIMVAASTGQSIAVASAVVPTGCLLYLVFIKSEFD